MVERRIKMLNAGLITIGYVLYLALVILGTLLSTQWFKRR